jgi:hypothetical protein
MVARHGDHIEPRPAQRGRAIGAGQHGMARLGQARAGGGKAGFQLAKGDVGRAQDIARGEEAFVVICAVHGQIAGCQKDMHHAHSQLCG